MISIRFVALGFFALMGSLTMTTVATLARDQTTSSGALLLSPRIHLGQSFSWKGRLTERVVDSGSVASGTGSAKYYRHPFEHFDSRTDIFTCTALTYEGDAFVMSRLVKVFLPRTNKKVDPGLESALRKVGLTMDQRWPVLEPKSSIILQQGYEFATNWRPLGDDPICMFYSVPMFGVPPATLKVGATWHFDRKSFSAWCKDCTGTTTVTNLDIAKSIVGLRIKMTAPNDSGYNPMVTDMVLADGGVTMSETNRSAFVTASAIPKEIGTPNAIDIWKLLHP